MTKGLANDDVERIRAAILAGRKIEAIKLYRQASGEGLYEAKVFIERLEDELGDVQPLSDSLPDQDLGPIREAIFAGDKIRAIQHYREITGQGIYEEYNMESQLTLTVTAGRQQPAFDLKSK